MIFDRNSQYQAYNMASQTVPKTKQIVMLYDGIIRFMQQAREAVIERRIQDRYNLLVKASEVIVALQNCLDYDNGGEVARILHDYYSTVDMSIISIHRSNSAEMCDRIVEDLKKMRGAWAQIDETGGASLSNSALADAPPSPLNQMQPLVTSDVTIPTASPAASVPIIVPEGGLQVSA